MNNIRYYRKKIGITQVELSKACNISQGTLSSYETGRFEPDNETLIKLAKFFNVSTDDILGYKQAEPSSYDDNDEEMWSFREELRRDPERRRLFKLAKYASLKDVKQADAIINALAATNPDFYDGDDQA